MRAEMTSPLIGCCDRCGQADDDLEHDGQGPVCTDCREGV